MSWFHDDYETVQARKAKRTAIEAKHNVQISDDGLYYIEPPTPEPSLITRFFKGLFKTALLVIGVILLIWLASDLPPLVWQIALGVYIALILAKL